MSIATQIGRIAKAKKDIKEVVNQDFEIINNETIDKYAEKMGTAYDEYESYIPWEHGEGSEFTFEKGGAGSYLKELEINGNTYQTTIAAETGKEVIGTSINVNDVNIEKENYITLKGNTHQDSYTGKNKLPYPYPENIKTMNGVTFTVQNDRSILVNGTATAQANIKLFGLQYQDTQKEFPAKYLYGGTNSVRLRALNNTNENFVVLATDTGNGAEIDMSTHNKGYIELTVPNGTTVNNVLIKPMMLNSLDDTTYEPYTGGTASPNPDYPQDVRVVTGDNIINVHGKNLLNFPYYETTKTVNGITFTVKNDGTIHVEGTASARAEFLIRNRDINLSITEGETYTLATSGLGVIDNTLWLDTYGQTGTFLDKWALPQTSTYTSAVAQSKDKKPLLRISVANGATVNRDVKVWLYKGSYDETTTYEPYQSQTYPINLGTMELCKIGTYQDYIYKDSGKWYKHSEIGKVVLTGGENENWNRTVTNNIARFELSGIDYLKGNSFVTDLPTFLSNNFTKQLFNDIANGVETGISWWWSSSLKLLIIGFQDSRSLQDFKAWLSTHNTSAYYPLATPTNTEITDTDLIEQLEALYTAQIYNPTFIETTTSNLLPYINLKYNVVTSSPSPERPSDIEVVSGDNVVNVHGKNIAYKNVITTTNDGYLNTNTGFFAYVESGETYTLSLNIASDNTTTGYTEVRCYTAQTGGTNQGRVTNFNRINGGGEITKTFTSSYTGYLVFSGSGMLGNSEVFTNIQLEVGTQATEYEPYQSKDYEIGLKSKNLFDKNNTNIAHKQATSNLTLNNDNHFVSIYVPAKEGRTYTISSTSNLFDQYSSLYFTSEDLNIATTCLSRTIRTPNTATSITATAPIGTKYVCAYIMYSTNQTDIDSLLSTIQIEQNSTATEYEEFYDYKLCKIGDYQDEIDKSTGKNLFDKDNLQGHFFYNSNTYLPNATNLDWDCSDFIKVKNNTQYTVSLAKLSTSSVNCQIIEWDKDKNGIANVWGNIENKTITTNNNTAYLTIAYNNTVYTNAQLEQNSQATDYEPYGEQWYIKKNIGKVVLDGDENYIKSIYSDTNYCTFITNDFNSLIGNNGQSNLLSNYFISNNIGSSIPNKTGMSYISKDYGLRFAIEYSNASDVAGFQTWLSTHNTIVYYVLANPTYEIITNETLINQLEELTKLDTYNNYSAVTATGDLINPELECVLFSQPAYQK